MKRRRREIDVFSMSFLDVVSCGFGAVILLLVISLAFEPITVERITRDLRGLTSNAVNSREKLIKESAQLRQELGEKEASLEKIRTRFQQLQGKWQSVMAAATAAQAGAKAERQREEELKQQLEQVRQTLDEEMRRLLSQPGYRLPGKDAVIGGIPVDSEYVIFVIDTSGSMRMIAWPLVIKKVGEVLKSYPHVKGIQVVNDMGRYMFGSYAGRWIPDTPARRNAILDRLKSWSSFSNSSPVEGVVKVISQFYRRDRSVSVFVFGDDFTGKSINDVVKEVLRINKRARGGDARVRVHAFGFPVLFLAEKGQQNRRRFAHLMRLLAEQNGGSFVGLNSLK